MTAVSFEDSRIFWNGIAVSVTIIFILLGFTIIAYVREKNRVTSPNAKLVAQWMIFAMFSLLFLGGTSFLVFGEAPALIQLKLLGLILLTIPGLLACWKVLKAG